MPLKNKEELKAYNREYHKRWYAIPENAEKQKRKAKQHRETQLRRNREFILDYKMSHPCKCGEDHPACLAFHHTDANKEACVSEMVSGMYSIKRIQKEIDKCVVMCSNCHLKLHWEERNGNL